MKNVFLIGDSIRCGVSTGDGIECGYGIHVKRTLEKSGVANVFYSQDNSRFLQYALRYIHEWASVCDAKSIDVVHWNNGLWDLLRLFGDDVFTPLDMYKSYLVRVHDRIRMIFPNAKIIFALSTPVSEEMSPADFTRRNSEIEQYNEAAIEVLTPLGVKINDLYSLAKEIRPNYYLDWVHYNPEGSAILAQKVCNAITEEF